MKRSDFIKVNIEREINPLDKYDEVIHAFENLYLIRDKENKQYGIINTKFEEVIPCLYDKNDIIDFFKRQINKKKDNDQNKLLLYKINGIVGYQDLNNNIIINPDYQKALPFSENFAAVKKDGYWGFIDKSNLEVIPFMYEYALSFQEGLAPVKQNGHWGFIDKNNQVIIPFKYEDAFNFNYGYALVKENNVYIFIDKLGNKLTSNILETIFIQDKNDLSSDIKRFHILEYLSIYELDNETIVVSDKTRANYIKSLASIESYLLEDKVSSLKIKKLK